jgi:hypothetical protein
MRDKEETMLGKFWLISCIDCRGSEAWTILWAVWCPKSVGTHPKKKGAIIAIEGYESWKKKNNKLQIPFSSQTSRVSDIVDDNR